MLDTIRNLINYEKPDIGLSGNPQRDIRTHRSLARDIDLMAFAMAFIYIIGAHYGTFVKTIQSAALLVASMALMFVASEGLRREAHEWELQYYVAHNTLVSDTDG